MAHAYVHLSGGCGGTRSDVRWPWNVHAETDSSLHDEHLKLSTRCGPSCPTCYIYICFKVGEWDGSERGGWEPGGGAEYSIWMGILSCGFQETLQCVAHELSSARIRWHLAEAEAACMHALFSSAATVTCTLSVLAAALSG